MNKKFNKWIKKPYFFLIQLIYFSLNLQSNQDKEKLMPPSGFSKKAVQGALQFIEGCYEDLLAEVRKGEHPSVEAALKFELEEIGKALEEVHIDKDSKLVRRET